MNKDNQSLYEGWTMYSPSRGLYFGMQTKGEGGAYHSVFDWPVRFSLAKSRDEIIKIFNECRWEIYGGKAAMGFKPIYVKIQLTTSIQEEPNN